MKRLILIIFMLPFVCIGQKFMIKNGDTLLYSLTMKINKDTLSFDNNTTYTSDTTYYGHCPTFEKIKGQIVNVTTTNCIPKGFWIIKKKDGLTKKGYYNDRGKLKGVWKTYDQNGQLVKEIEYTSVAKDTYVLSEIHYVDGVKIVVSKKTWFASFYLKNVLSISILLGLAFFSRIFINSLVYNRINGTNYFPIYFNFGSIVSNNFEHSIQCTFMFWWNIKKLSEMDKNLGLLNNVLSAIAVGGFACILIGLAISGELIK